MNRRDFIKSTAAVTGGGIFTGLRNATAQSGTDSDDPVSGPQPNILFILVDELRYPTVFPAGIKTVEEFLAKHMKNVYELWKQGVKFGNYHTAANACTPSRGVMISGLYSQQSWLITTILSTPFPPPALVLLQPVLNPAYPTFGKLLRTAGYQTPYFGKWHASIPQQNTGGLENYGFDFHTYPDPTGSNLQGTYGDENLGYHNDAYTVDQAVNWLGSRKADDTPWCTTVSLVNPHDREFFPAGTEFQDVNNLFANPHVNPQNLGQAIVYPGKGPNVPYSEDALKSPPSFGYPTVPPNWESTQDLIDHKKPPTQLFIREFSQLIWGGITDSPSQHSPVVEDYPQTSLGLGVIKMPYSYWQRGLDSYTQIMEIVDGQIGRVLEALEALPESIVENTIVIFAADHGEYSGAHGFVQGKVGTVYDEAWHIPLIVVDPSHRFTGDIDSIRTGLASSVDLMPLLVSLGNKGTRDWMKGDLAKIYGKRHDMISMLKSANAPGRSYVLYAIDEIAPGYYNYNGSPTHIVGLRTEDTKLGTYADWFTATVQIDPSSAFLEFYDYSTTEGKLELMNTADSDARSSSMFQTLLNDLIPNELQALLPGTLAAQQEKSKIAHLIYRAIIANLPNSDFQAGAIRSILGYGAEF
jgi:arylsulfatase A-like enzyme